MPLFTHNLAASPLDNTTCRYVIQQRRETSLSWKLIKKKKQEKKKRIKLVFGSLKSGTEVSQKQHFWREVTTAVNSIAVNNQSTADV